MKHKYTDVIKEIIDSESVDFKLAKDTPREITHLILISFENTVLSAKQIVFGPLDIEISFSRNILVSAP